MKVIHLSTYDIAGGAARAAYRLHQGLQHINLDSQMLVQGKFSDDKSVISPQTHLEKTLASIGNFLDGIPLHFYSQRQKTEFSTQWAPERIISTINQLNPNIINLHWINKSHVQIETIANLNKPIVWTLHDMWAFTGGCHYTQDCNKFVDSCGACPLLGSNKNFDLSHSIWQRKHKAWKDVNLIVVCLSEWMAKCASSSSLFRNTPIEIIPNGIDTHQYKPINRQIVRELLNLPQDKQIVLFGAINATSSPRKGFYFLQLALQNLCKTRWRDKIELVVIGASQPDNQTDFGFKTKYLGKLSDDISLTQIYAAADVFVAPSVQDNLPNTIMEAMSCGTPCVGFDVGGMPDMIEHQKNGYLAQPFEIEDLAQGIAWVLENKQRHQKLCEYARRKVEQEFSQELQARRYASLYTNILNEEGKNIIYNSDLVTSM